MAAPLQREASLPDTKGRGNNIDEKQTEGERKVKATSIKLNWHFPMASTVFRKVKYQLYSHTCYYR